MLTNPPFGRKSSLTFVNSKGETERETLTVERPDFWAATSNKQLNFLQHVRALLKNTGRAAIVAPHNVLFEGGAGETVRRRLLAECDVQTLKANPLTRAGLDDFVACYHPDNCLRREESERFRRFSYPESIRSG